MRLSLLWNRRLADDVWRNFPSGKIVLAYRRSYKYTGMAQQRGNDSCFSGKTFLPKKAAFFNVLVFYVVLKALTVLLPNTAFRSGFTNGLMSESMVLFFCGYMAVFKKNRKFQGKNSSVKY